MQAEARVQLGARRVKEDNRSFTLYYNSSFHVTRLQGRRSKSCQIKNPWFDRVSLDQCLLPIMRCTAVSPVKLTGGVGVHTTPYLRTTENLSFLIKIIIIQMISIIMYLNKSG